MVGDELRVESGELRVSVGEMLGQHIGKCIVSAHR